MANGASTYWDLILPEVEADDNAWGDDLNAGLVIIDSILGKSTNVTTTTGNVALTASQMQAASIRCTGILVGDLFLVFGTQKGTWFVYNNTSGNFEVAVKCTGQSDAPRIAQGSGVMIMSDGTDVTIASVPAGGDARHFNQICPHSNLVVKRASNTTVTITADAVVLYNTSGNGKRFATVSKTPAITTSGALGLDTGSEAPSTWYSIYLIGKQDGTLSAVFSVSRGGAGPAGGVPVSAPTLPSGYTYWGFVGCVRNNASSNFIHFHQRGNSASGNAEDYSFSALGMTAGSFTLKDISPYCPPEALSVTLQFTFINSLLAPSSVLDFGVYVAPSAQSAGVGGYRFLRGYAYVSGLIEMPLETAQTIYTRAAGTDGTGFNNQSVCGWTL